MRSTRFIGENSRASRECFLIPESGVKKGIGCEFRADLAGLPLQIFIVSLTSLLVRLRSGCVDRLGVWKSPLATGSDALRRHPVLQRIHASAAIPPLPYSAFVV